MFNSENIYLVENYKIHRVKFHTHISQSISH
jgi:hypothetical protein